MKKLLLCFAPVLLAACATPEQVSSVPLDTQAVAAYQQRIANGQSNDAATVKDKAWLLNASDYQPKVTYDQRYHRVYVVSPVVDVYRYPRFGGHWRHF